MRTFATVMTETLAKLKVGLDCRVWLLGQATGVSAPIDMTPVIDGSLVKALSAIDIDATPGAWEWSEADQKSVGKGWKFRHKASNPVKPLCVSTDGILLRACHVETVDDGSKPAPK